MRAAATGLLFALAGCAGAQGVALELTVERCAALDPAGTEVDFVVTLTPPAAADGRDRFTLPGPALFAEAGRSNRVTLLLPAATTHATVAATVRRGATPLATTEKSWDFAGPGEVTDALSFACGPRDGGTDLASRDMPSPGDGGAPMIAQIEVRGARGAPAYEAEGAEAPMPESGVAVLITGSGFGATPAIASPDGRFVPATAAYVNAAGTRIATSFRLLVDPNTAMGQPRYPLSITTAGGTAQATFAVNALPELQLVGNTTLACTGPPLEYSAVTVDSGNLSITSGQGKPAYMWVSGRVTLKNAGWIGATPQTGGFPAPGKGAGGSIQANGPGFGGEGTFLGGGGGASQSTVGQGGGGGPNAGGPGALYGDPSLIGLLGGSGGGASANAGGGQGGGILRIQAGAVAIGDGSLFANGAAGVGNAICSGGGGSGGGVVIQSATTITNGGGQLLAVGGQGGVGGNGGGDGGRGRVRVDAAAPWNGLLATPAIGYAGGAVAADFPTAWKVAPMSVPVVCGLSTSFRVLVDGMEVAPKVQCMNPGAADRMTVAINPQPLTAGATHALCVQLQPNGNLLPAQAGALAEDLNCRAVVIGAP